MKFVLCTTEPEKLPITILSRCQRFDFTTVDTPSIARRLAQIVEAEGADVSAEALRLIARRAAGSMRDSQSLLEQLLGSASGKIGVDDVHALIGTGREERIGELVVALAGRDAARALAVLDASLEGGADAGGVLEQLLAALRDCLLASVGCEASLLTQSQGLGVDLAGLGGRLGTATLLAMLQILDQSLSRMRTSGHAAILAEMAVIRLATLEDLESVATAIDRLASPAAAAAAPSRLAAPRPAAAPAPTPQKKTADLIAESAEPAVSPPAGSPSAAATPGVTSPAAQRSITEVSSPEAAPPGLPEDASEAWQAAAGVLEGLASDFAAEVTAAVWRDDVLEVSLPAHAATAAAFLRRPEMAASVARAIESLAGRRVRHAVVLAAPVTTVAAAAVGTEPQSRPAPAQSQAALLREAGEHPLVAHARTVFDAAIRKVEPPRSREPRPAAPVAVAGGRPVEADDGRFTEDDPETGTEETDG